MQRKMALMAAVAVLTVSSLLAGEIIHDAEYYVLEAQHGERWAEQDKELQAKLAALREKHGTPPNIIHIMWDDTPVARSASLTSRRCAAGKPRTSTSSRRKVSTLRGCTLSPRAPRAGRR